MDNDMVEMARRLGRGEVHRLREENVRLRNQIERMADWQETSPGAYCTAVEQLNRIVAGLIREYGCDGELVLSATFANEIPLGRQICWACIGDVDEFIVIREAEGR